MYIWDSGKYHGTGNEINNNMEIVSFNFVTTSWNHVYNNVYKNYN